MAVGVDNEVGGEDAIVCGVRCACAIDGFAGAVGVLSCDELIDLVDGEVEGEVAVEVRRIRRCCRCWYIDEPLVNDSDGGEPFPRPNNKLEKLDKWTSGDSGPLLPTALQHWILRVLLV